MLHRNRRVAASVASIGCKDWGRSPVYFLNESEQSRVGAHLLIRHGFINVAKQVQGQRAFSRAAVIRVHEAVDRLDD